MSGFQDRASNHGFSDRWTCPGCYADLPNKREGVTTCPSCAARLRLSVEYEPVSTAEVIADDDDTEDAE